MVIKCKEDTWIADMTTSYMKDCANNGCHCYLRDEPGRRKTVRHCGQGEITGIGQPARPSLI